MAYDENKNIKFVLEVEKYPCLYNTTLSSYSRRTETDKAWSEIGKTMKMTGAACKDKWRNLRVVFMRHWKALPIGSGRKNKKPYYLLDYMHFLTPYVKPMIPPAAANLPSTSSTENTEIICATNDVSNDVNTDSEQSTEHCDVEHTSPSKHDNRARYSSNPKRKKSSLHETDKYFIDYLKQKSTHLSTNQTSMDVVMSFLNSLAPELREMNLQQFKMFKRRVLSLVDDILNQPPTAPENAATSQLTTLSNETSHQIIYSPKSQYTEYGSSDPLDFSGVSNHTPSNFTENTTVKQDTNFENFL